MAVEARLERVKWDELELLGASPAAVMRGERVLLGLRNLGLEAHRVVMEEGRVSVSGPARYTSAC